MIDFLTELYDQGLGYSAICTARSALSAIMGTVDGKTIGQHYLISHFVKGVFELRTPVPRFKQTWDISVLLNFFREKKKNQELTLKELTHKLCALLMVVSAQRVQTIHLIRLSCLHFKESGCTVHIVDKLKQTRPGFHQAPLELPSFAEENLCVVKCLQEYIKRTKPLRGDNDKLLLCYMSPHAPASKDTVARWLKAVLVDCGLEEFVPHSFRSASSSAMLKSGLSITEVMKNAGWSNENTFRKFYQKTVANDTAKRSDKTKGKKSDNSLLNYFSKSEK